MQKNGLSQQLKRRQKGGTEARRRLGVRLGFVATSPSEGEEEENGTASMMCGRGESHKGVVNRGREAGQAQTGWDAATTRPVPRSLGPRRKNKVARVDPRTPTSLETARPPLAMSHAYCVVPRRGEATGINNPRPPKAGGLVLHSLRAVALEEISLQQSAASDPSSKHGRSAAGSGREVGAECSDQERLGGWAEIRRWRGFRWPSAIRRQGAGCDGHVSADTS